jgi:DNA (cytosine-5)-methyltransferase 1
MGNAALNGCGQGGSLAGGCNEGDRTQGSAERFGFGDRFDCRMGDAESEQMGRAGLPWQDSVWLSCLDGKVRRVEPAIFPLAYAGEWGSGSRVGILRAAGNAIVPALAAAFVRAFMDAIKESNTP